jgi:hypothetical protein
MPKVLTEEHKLKMQEGQRKARAARKALAEAAQEAEGLYDGETTSKPENHGASYNTGTGVSSSYRRVSDNRGATADTDSGRTGQHRSGLRVVTGRERNASGSDQLSAGATSGGRTDTATPDYRNQRAATGDYRAPSIATRLQDGIARAGNAVLDRVSSIGKSSEEETDEEDDAEEDDSEPAGIVRAFETWRDEHGGVLTDKEAEERREDLIDKLVFYSGQMDRFLTISNTQHAESQLWQLSPKEAKPLANIWLRRARKNVNVAVSLRAFMDGDEYVQAAVVLIPRLAGTGLWWQRHGGFNLESWQQ